MEPALRGYVAVNDAIISSADCATSKCGAKINECCIRRQAFPLYHHQEGVSDDEDGNYEECSGLPDAKNISSPANVRSEAVKYDDSADR
ncbi:hypothetical protein PsorP6_014631 [Peronosclerospora sorghi]|uniref:Uncharacterized protein n=1 Tax=Peronosclerospora sorghi TaxID=230839 RepID=A0ACC0VRP1_9STRA|nr:hypothetical protein PsorP6_014631 [Peronosclerospora sorghi]